MLVSGAVGSRSLLYWACVEDRWAIVAYLRALQRAQNIYTARN